MAKHFRLIDHIGVFLCHDFLVNRGIPGEGRFLPSPLALIQLMEAYAIASMIAFSVALGRMALDDFASSG